MAFDKLHRIDARLKERRYHGKVFVQLLLQRGASSGRQAAGGRIGDTNRETAHLDERSHHLQRELVPEEYSVEAAVHDRRAESSRLNGLSYVRSANRVTEEILQR